MSEEVRREHHETSRPRTDTDRETDSKPDADAKPECHSDRDRAPADSTGRHSIDPESGIHLSLRVPDRPTLHDALRSLVRSEVSFEINRISDAGVHSSLAIVDLDELTEKQREAIELATEKGYYETPRETDLDAISDELGVSKSAVSQRLRATESKLIQSVLTGHINGENSPSETGE